MQFELNTFMNDAVTARSLKAQKAVSLCLQSASAEVIKVLADNPEVEPETIAQKLAAHLHTFLMIGASDAFDKAPQAFADALDAKGIGLCDLDIAAFAYGAAAGQSFIITRKPKDARDYRQELEASGKIAKQWNQGAYIIVYVVAQS